MRTGGAVSQPEVRAAFAGHGAGELELYRDFVLRSLRRQGVGHADAEDLVQEAFLIASRRWTSFDPARPLRAWLAGIVVKVAHRHRITRARLVAQADLDLPDSTDGPDERLDTARQWALLWQALDRLPEAQRELLLLHHLEDVPVQEIAALQGIPLFTAYTRLRAARLHLGRQVEALGPRRARAMIPLLATFTPAPGGAAGPTSHRPAAGPPRAAGRPQSSGGARWRFWLPAVGAVAGALALLLQPAAAWSWLQPGKTAAPVSAPASASNPAARLARSAIGSLPDHRPPPPSFVSPGAAGSEPVPAGHRLIGHWTFDEMADSPVVHDRSARGNHCQVRHLPGIAPRPAPPAAPGVRVLDGHSWLECARTDALAALDTELTVAVWMKPASTGRRQVLVTRQLGSSGDRTFSLRVQNGAFEFLSHIWARMLRRTIPAGTAGDGWLHVAAVRDGNGTRLYVNGAEIGHNLRTGGLTLSGSTPLIIGGQLNGPERNQRVQDLFEGALDDVRLYARALSAAEVGALSLDRLEAPRPPS